MSHNNLIAKDGWPIIGFFAIITIIFHLLKISSLTWLFLLITIFCIYFFRNPRRVSADEEGIVVAPADGKVKSITKVYEDKFIQDEAICISIFLSLFNVHINRVPISGVVDFTKKQGLSFRPAYKSDVRNTNVSTYTGLETRYGRVLVVQITGIIARRIVTWVKKGDIVQTGKHLGLIRFGSCTEVYLPVGAQIMVEIGQSIRGGETIIAKLND